MATEAQMQAFVHYCEEVGAALDGLVTQAQERGIVAPITLSAIIGSLAALGVAHGLQRENVIAALNSAWNDAESSPAEPSTAA